MGRPKLTKDGSVQSAIRMSPETWERADELIPYLSRKRGTTVSRTEVLREALNRGLDALEEDEYQADEKKKERRR